MAIFQSRLYDEPLVKEKKRRSQFAEIRDFPFANWITWWLKQSLATFLSNLWHRTTAQTDISEDFWTTNLLLPRTNVPYWDALLDDADCWANNLSNDRLAWWLTTATVVKYSSSNKWSNNGSFSRIFPLFYRSFSLPWLLSGSRRNSREAML